MTQRKFVSRSLNRLNQSRLAVPLVSFKSHPARKISKPTEKKKLLSQFLADYPILNINYDEIARAEHKRGERYVTIAHIADAYENATSLQDLLCATIRFHDNPKTLQLLEDYPTLINFVDSNLPPLVEAVFRDNQELIPILVEQYNADVNQANLSGITPLYRACNSLNTNIVKYLLEHHADINGKGWAGQKPLAATVSKMFLHKKFSEPLDQCIELIQLLVDYGANPDEKDGFLRMTPREYIIANCKESEVLQALLNALPGSQGVNKLCEDLDKLMSSSKEEKVEEELLANFNVLSFSSSTSTSVSMQEKNEINSALSSGITLIQTRPN